MALLIRIICNFITRERTIIDKAIHGIITRNNEFDVI